MNSERIVWADYAKAFSICAVVLYHTQLPNPFKHYVYIFCLPAFFFLSGMFAHKWQSLTTKDFLKKIFIRRIIPYLFWGIVAYIIWLINQRIFPSTDQWWKPILGLIYGTSNFLIQNKPLWFLPCLCLIECIYYGINKISPFKNKSLYIIFLFIIGIINSIYNSYILPWGLSSALVMILLYMLGDIIGNTLSYNNYISNLTFSKLICLFIGSLLGTYLLARLNPCVKISSNQYGNIFIFILECIGVILTWSSAGTICEKLFHKSWFSNIVGEHSLFILGSHLIYFKFIKLLVAIGDINLSIFENNYWMSIVLWMLTLLLSILTILLLQNFISKNTLSLFA